MKNIRQFSFLIFFILLQQSLSAQRVGLGLNASLGIETKSDNTGVGLGVNAQFLPVSSNYYFRVSVRPFYSQVNAYFLKHSLSATSYELAVMYSAKEGIGRPFLGVGIGYVTLQLEQNGNALFRGNKMISLREYDNPIVLNIFAGASFNRHKLFEPYIELNYRVMPIFMKVSENEAGLAPVIRDETYTHTEIVLNVGFMFNF